MRTLAVSVVLAGVALGAAPAAGAAEPYEIFATYTTDGSLEACDYTAAELRAAVRAVTPNVRSYASDYPRALRHALRVRARGDCDPGAPEAGGNAPSPTAAPGTDADAPLVPEATGTPVPAATPPPAVAAPSPAAATPPSSAAPDDDAPSPLLALGTLAVLLALAALVVVTLRRLGPGEGRMAPAYHACREARWRAGGAWADFRDWLRLGR